MRKSLVEDCDIDFVITWVDGTDPAWLEQKAKHLGNDGINLRQVDHRDIRYRPWDTLRYLFRGIDKFAPWVRKVHFVTCGHLPDWLDTNNSKLAIVKHADYIPEEYLPTFSSRTIEFNFHRIPGLAEHFVNFNDDMMIIGPTEPSDFFIGGLPCDSAVLTPFRVLAGDWHYASATNVAVINKYYTARESVGAHPFKWLNFKYGRDMLRTISMLPYPSFFGFKNYHLPDSLMKSTFEEIWDKEPQLMTDVCSHKFRVPTDPNQWLFQDWQLAAGNFEPRRKDVGATFQITDENKAAEAAMYITRGKNKFVCLNDNLVDTANAELAERLVVDALKSLLPECSSFELNNGD